MADLLITTTPILSGVEIKRYIGPITANVVLGVNFFADFAASLTDVFGGNSERYQSKLYSLTFEVEKIMKANATRIGANAIIDYKLQFNEISGKGKQMFMVTATGTACVVSKPMQEHDEEIGQVSYSQIRRQYYISLYRKKLNDEQCLTEKNWENINSLNISEILHELTYEYFRLASTTTEDYNMAAYKILYSSKYEEYLNKVSKPEAAKCLYEFLNSNPEKVTDLVIKHNLFSPKAVLDQITSNNLTIAVNLLRSHKDYYTKEDLIDMKKIVSILSTLPDTGSFQIMKSGLFSKKEEEIFMCQNGHKNSKDATYCSVCHQNIKGLTSEQDGIITRFAKITEALQSVLK